MAKNDRAKTAAKRLQLRRALIDPRHDESAAENAYRMLVGIPDATPASFAETPRRTVRLNQAGKRGPKTDPEAAQVAAEKKFLDSLLNIDRLSRLPRLREGRGNALDVFVKREAERLKAEGLPPSERVRAIQIKIESDQELRGKRGTVSRSAIVNSLKRQGLWWGK
ncbi:hypothetical protein [Extensimonas sp. H3M7-6]|uniref:hypothetical protein n=1 Tax=Extensimonas soli TaxID=3031322 RepID=UPI0023DA669B|nr:hypothetical protein [Extensimonas sp. H3M7-6]MDF1482212.1 hypothetical protein [Extensimonas sp. H3M7-6]